MTNYTNLQPLTAPIEIARFFGSTIFRILALMEMLEMRDRYLA
jgi:hypothetical protein